MGFGHCTINRPALAKELGIDVTTLDAAMDKCRMGGFARVWRVDDMGNFAKVQLSTSKKNKDSNAYESDFQSYVSFVGNAYNLLKSLMTDANGGYEDVNGRQIYVFTHGITVQITNANATTTYIKDKNATYHNYAVFSFAPFEASGTPAAPSKGGKVTTAATAKKPAKKPAKKAGKPVDVEAEDDDELPF